MTTKQLRETRKIELVETHNIALSLDRLARASTYQEDATRRALYHALCMTGTFSAIARAKIREALELP
jgi:hypothetical protein